MKKETKEIEGTEAKEGKSFSQLFSFVSFFSCLSLIASASFPSAAYAADFSSSAIGTTGSQFLTQDIGARGIGMGGAFTAVADDATSIYWNPAGLTRVPRFSSSFMYSQYLAGITYQSVEAAERWDDNSVLGGGVRYQNAGSIPETNLSGTGIGTFTPQDFVLEGAWAQSIDDLSDNDMDISMGVAGRWIHSDYVLSANGYGGDLGILAHFYNGPFPVDLGFSAQNIGSGQQFDQVRDTLPFRAKFGTAAYPIQGLILSLDVDLPSDNTLYGAIGAEYSIEVGNEMKASMRGGLNTETLDSLGLASMLSVGVGLKLTDLSFDYAFQPQGLLGDVHRISISYNLPAIVSQRYEER